MTVEAGQAYGLSTITVLRKGLVRVSSLQSRTWAIMVKVGPMATFIAKNNYT